MKAGNLKLLESSGPIQACTWIPYIYRVFEKQLYNFESV
jgi:hypothetical protein